MKSREQALLLVAMAALIVLERWHTWAEPLHGDLTQYAVMAHAWLRGRPLYADLVDHSPPARYLTYAAGELLFGYGLRGVELLNLAGSLVLLAGIFAAGRALGGAAAGLWAAGFWSVISGDLRFQANEPWTELFIGIAMTFALALLCEARAPPGRARTVAAGACLGLATLYWQPMGAAVALVLACALLHSWRRALALALAAGALWALVFASLAISGSLPAFIHWVFVYNRAYAALDGGIAGHLASALAPEAWPQEIRRGAATWLLPLLGLAGAGFALALVARRGKPWALLLAYGLGAAAAAAQPRTIHAHYCQLLLPPLVLGAGLGLAELGGLPLRRARAAALAAGALVLALLVRHELPFYELPAAEWSRASYGSEFIATERVGKDLGQLLLPEENFYNWGTQTGLYFWSGKPLLTGAFYNFFLINGPGASALSARTLAELERAEPELFIAIAEGASFYRDHPIYQWGRARYRQLEWQGHGGPFLFYARRGGALERRIERGLAPARFLAEAPDDLRAPVETR